MVLVCVDWGWEGMVLVLRLVNTRGEQERRTMQEGSRSEGLVSLQFQNQSVQCHGPASQQVLVAHDGEGSWLRRAGWAWPTVQWCGCGWRNRWLESASCISDSC